MTLRRGLLIAILGAALALFVAPLLGVEMLSPVVWLGGDPLHAQVFWSMRVPRVIVGFLAGAALATSGVVFQAMFRNPLAEPYTLGIASGASLGAAIAILSGASVVGLGFSAVSLAALVGALAVVAAIIGIARLRRGFSAATMLLAGVAISFFCSSLILFLQYLSDFTQTFRMLRWVMGGLDAGVSDFDVFMLLPLVGVGCGLVYLFAHELNLLATGEELAASRGVELGPTKLALFLAASVMVGGVVAVCGPIGFVGLMAPHICRLLLGPEHRGLVPASLLFGGTFLVLCDALARVLLAPAEIPVGIITALLGGPFFLWLLLRRMPDLGGVD
ncbi:MAG: FecCD family ABC transporter permease [Planctomycetota bacterium]